MVKMPLREKVNINRKPLAALVDATLTIEKLRISSQIRQTHLKRQGTDDPETDELLRRIKTLELYVDGRIASLITSHPAFPWFSRVKGVGKENIGKVVALIDIEKATTISALWKYSGYAVDNGHAPRRIKGGGTLTYNSELRTMCWRLATSLLKANGKFHQYYLAQKDQYRQRYENEGIRIVPSAELPKNKDGKLFEPEGVISGGHLHQQALRKMIKLFLACLWLTWRKAEGLPLSRPYAIDHLHHNSMIEPCQMVDKEAVEPEQSN